MQRLTAPPRDALTEAQVRAIVNADTIKVTPGLELLDANNNVTSDESAYLVGGTVHHDVNSVVPGTCDLQLSKEYAWGSDRLRPYLTLAADGVSARFNLGVYFPTTPERQLAVSDPTYKVTGYDTTHILQRQVGDTVVVGFGTGYLDAVRTTIYAAGGGNNVRLDATAQATTITHEMVWVLHDDHPTYLEVCNDLLAAVGYRPLWVDPDGYYRSDPYVAPATRAADWAFDATDPTNCIVVDQSITYKIDAFADYNWWRFLQRNAEAQPVEGAGMYTVDLSAGGTKNRKVVTLDVEDQASLVTQGDAVVDADTQVTRTLDLTASAFPLLDHLDVATVTTSDIGVVKVLINNYSIDVSTGTATMQTEVL